MFWALVLVLIQVLLACVFNVFNHTRNPRSIKDLVMLCIFPYVIVNRKKIQGYPNL